jgi:hypothetical protein
MNSVKVSPTTALARRLIGIGALLAVAMLMPTSDPFNQALTSPANPIRLAAQSNAASGHRKDDKTTRCRVYGRYCLGQFHGGV